LHIKYPTSIDNRKVRNSRSQNLFAVVVSCGFKVDPVAIPRAKILSKSIKTRFRQYKENTSGMETWTGSGELSEDGREWFLSHKFSRIWNEFIV
jgi:hypothetical protein